MQATVTSFDELTDARRQLGAVLAVARAQGTRRTEAELLRALAQLALAAGDLVEAAAVGESARCLFARLGDASAAMATAAWLDALMALP